MVITGSRYCVHSLNLKNPSSEIVSSFVGFKRFCYCMLLGQLLVTLSTQLALFALALFGAPIHNLW